MFDLLQHTALVIGVLDLLHLDHLSLFQHLDGIEALVVLGLDEMDSPKAAGAESALDLEVGERVLALGDAGLVKRLRLELDGAILSGRIGCGGGGIVGVYQVLYARDVVRGLGVGLRAGLLLVELLLLLMMLLLLGLRVTRGIHRVHGLGLRRRGRGRGAVYGLGRLVRLCLVEMEGARGALRRRGRERGAGVDGRRRAVQVVGALRILRPLLLEESEARHRSGGSRGMPAGCCPGSSCAAAGDR
jgi:hypothetical protein